MAVTEQAVDNISLHIEFKFFTLSFLKWKRQQKSSLQLWNESASGTVTFEMLMKMEDDAENGNAAAAAGNRNAAAADDDDKDEKGNYAF